MLQMFTLKCQKGGGTDLFSLIISNDEDTKRKQAGLNTIIIVRSTESVNVFNYQYYHHLIN
jgi:hypothetical protein